MNSGKTSPLLNPPHRERGGGGAHKFWSVSTKTLYLWTRSTDFRLFLFVWLAVCEGAFWVGWKNSLKTCEMVELSGAGGGDENT